MNKVALTDIKRVKYAGGYRLGKGIEHAWVFRLTYKPSALHRYFMRKLLGFYWSEK